MNKKFTMMLAAFIAAGYSVTVEAGVVKLTKTTPEDGQTIVIANEEAKKLLGVQSNVDEVETVGFTDINSLGENKNHQWKVSGTQGSFSLINQKEGALNAQLSLDGGTLSVVNSKNNISLLYNAIGVSPYRVEYTDGEFKSVSSNTAAVDLFLITENVNGDYTIKVGDKYLVLTGTDSEAKIEALSAIEIAQKDLALNAKWVLTDGVAANAKLTNYKLTEYNPSNVEGCTASKDEDANYLVFSVKDAGSTWFYGNSEENVVNAQTAYNNGIFSVTFPSVSTGQSAVSSIDNMKNVSLWISATDVVSKASNAAVKKEAYESAAKIENVYWTYNKTTGVFTNAAGVELIIDGAKSFVVEGLNEDGNFMLAFTKDDAKYYVTLNGTTWGSIKASDITNMLTDNVATFTARTMNYTTTTSVEDFNKLVQGGFEVSYTLGETVAEGNVFDNVTAIQLSSAVGKYAEGIYFAVNAPAGTANKTSFTEEELNKLTFVAVNSANMDAKYPVVGEGKGATLTTVEGKNLINSTFLSNNANKIVTSNAAFSFKTSDLTPEEMIISPKDKVYLNDGDNLKEVSASDLVVSAVKNREGKVNVVLAATDDEVEQNYIVNMVSANVVTYKEFLKETAQVFNIKFLSTTAAAEAGDQTLSEYNKYLGVGESGTLLAQGADFVDLSLPQNQWVVSKMTEENVVTFTNRESEQSFTATLVKTDKADEYRLAGLTISNFNYLYQKTDGSKQIVSVASPAQNGMIVKLTAVAAGQNDGYVATDLIESDLVKIAFTPVENVVVDKVYVGLDGADVKLVKEDALANFKVHKFVEEYAHVTNIAVLKNDKPEVLTDKKDTLQVVTYAFELDEYKATPDQKSKYLTATMASVAQADKAENAARFIIKKLNNGKLAVVNFVDDFEATITSNAKGLDADYDNAKVKESAATIYEANEDSKPNAYVSFESEALNTSLVAEPKHYMFKNTNSQTYLAKGENNEAIMEAPSALKAEYTKDDLIFWVDTTDSEEMVPTFYISKGGKEFMFNALDSLTRYNDGTASEEIVKAYKVPNTENPRAIFRAATLKDSNTLTTSINGESKDLVAEKGIEDYQFKIVLKDNAVADEYVIRSAKNLSYLYEVNGQLGFTTVASEAIVLNVVPTEAPTSNEGVSASDVKVVAQNGSVVVMNAAGKNVVVSTILGQVVVNEVLTSDNATINVPAGIVVVAVEGESFKVNVK